MLRQRRLLALLALATFLLWGPAASVLQAALNQPSASAEPRQDEDAPKDSSEERGADEDGSQDLLLPASHGLNEPASLHFGDFLLRLTQPFIAAPDDPPNRA